MKTNAPVARALVYSAGITLTGLSSAATLVPVAGGGTTSNWDSRDGTTGLPNNWRIGGTAVTRTPSAAEGDLAIINGNRIVQVTTAVSAVAGEVRINNTTGGNQGNLEINSGGSLTTGLLRSTGTDGGNLTVQGTGSLTTAGAEINTNSSFNLVGSMASMSVSSFSAGAAGTLNLTFDSAGIFTLVSSGAYTITSGAALNIDGSLYTGGAGTFSLISATSRTGTDEFTESVTGFTGYTSDVVYSATGVDLVLTAIPEPGSGLFLGLGGLILFVRRRA